MKVTISGSDPKNIVIRVNVRILSNAEDILVKAQVDTSLDPKLILVRTHTDIFSATKPTVLPIKNGTPPDADSVVFIKINHSVSENILITLMMKVDETSK